MRVYYGKLECVEGVPRTFTAVVPRGSGYAQTCLGYTSTSRTQLFSMTYVGLYVTDDGQGRRRLVMASDTTSGTYLRLERVTSLIADNDITEVSFNVTGSSCYAHHTITLFDNGDFGQFP